ncbi:MAG: gliding motility-associated C-terminal domain-containing protein [Bacteroidia bacterium]
MKENVHKISLRLLLVLLLPINALLAQSPTISSFLPTAANVGSTITITGTNLTNVTKVWFGTAPVASFTAVNSTTITAVVPNNAYLGNIAVATTNGYTIGNKYFIVNNPQNAIIGNNDQNAVYYFKNGKLYGTKSYDYDNGNQYRNCPLEMASKGSLRGKTISQISNSGNHFIALASDNSVHAWGSNFRKELGDSSVNSRKSTSVDITNKGDLRGKTIIQVLAGSYAGYALSSDGQVFSWGQDTLGVLGNGVSTNGIVWVPTSISSYGSLVGKTIIKLCKTTAANGYNNVFAIASDGTIHAWGGNPASSLGTGNSSVAEVPVNINQSGVLAGKTIVEIDGGLNCTLLMDQDGLLYGMGNAGSIGVSGSVQANPVALDMLSGSSLFQKRALTILTGKRGSYGHVLDTSGALHAFGNNVFGNLGIGSTSNATRPVLVDATTSSITGKTIVGIAHGDYCVYLLASDNTMHGFGSASSLMNGLTTPNVNKAIAINTLMPPTNDATNLTVTAISQTTATITCNAGSGMGRLIVLKALNAVDTISVINGIIYTASAAQPGGSNVDGTGRVVYYNNGNTVNITGLVANRLYHVSVFEYDTFSSPCRYSVFKLGTPLSGSFTTTGPLSLATVRTSSATLVNSNSATLGGNVTADGGAAVSEKGVVYATTINPTTANTKVQIGNGLGTFSQNVSGLTPSTLYHVRAYAINSVGTSYGADSTFTTTSLPTIAPTVSTSKVTLIGVTNATLGGNVSDSGTAAVAERGVVYATTANPTTANTKVQIGAGLGTFSQNVIGLTATTLYHVRAYAINSVGTSYGADSTFTTLAGNTTPVVITGNAINIASSSATLSGNVVNDGGANVTERGVVFATTINPTTANNKVMNGIGTGVFSQSVTALTAKTTYHYRAYAVNSVGTAYGADSTFKTLEGSVFNENLYNAFSPDGDGINDNWVIDNAADLNDHEIVVFNIFGQEVFHQTGYTTPWDGKIDGNPVPSGEYYYLIKGSKINTKGALLIKNKQ